MTIKGRYPLILFVTAVLCGSLFVVLLSNRLTLFEAMSYCLVLASALYVLFGRGASRFLLNNGVLHVYPLLSRAIAINLSQYDLVDYKLNFLSLDRKSSFFFTGAEDTLVFSHRETNVELSIQLNARMRDTRLLIKTLLKPSTSSDILGSDM